MADTTITSASNIVNVIIQGILAAIQAAPQVAAVVTAAKALLAGLVEAKMITVEQQAAVHAFADARAALAAAGITPPSWVVEADPVTSTAP